MEFDDLQRAWQAQNPAAQVTIKAELLLKEVRRNQRQFWATIFWRDVREVGVALLLALYFLYHGWTHHNWTDYLNTMACLGIGLFMVVDRRLQRKKKPIANDALKHCLEVSLAEVNHQIWLLKNVFWWYLLPLLVASAISMCQENLHMRHFDRGTAVGAMLAALIVAWFFRFVYRLNQRAVRKSLEPRREELKALLASLG
jgi:Na+/proline symporter